MFQERHNVSSCSETDLIASIRSWLGPLSPSSPEGIGDDCAVFPVHSENRQIITSDALTYRRHFDDSVSAFFAGKKLVNRNLSDIAAMGGTPERAILTLLFGPDLALNWLEDFFRGLGQASEAAGLQIVGGDLSGLDPGEFSSVLTVIGRAPTPILRKTAAAGDRIMVTGRLGGSLAGKHYRFEPRLEEGRWLAESGECSSLMDLSDGLAKDLPNLLPENRAANLDLNSIPLAAEAHAAAGKSGRTAIEHALGDGEDYELLFTVRSDSDLDGFLRAWNEVFPQLSLTEIGKVVDKNGEDVLIDSGTGKGVVWGSGFEHFKAK